MSETKEAEKYIRKVIKDDHQGNDLATSKEIMAAITSITEAINNSNHNYPSGSIKEFAFQYLHFSDKKKSYYFSTNRKQKNVPILIKEIGGHIDVEIDKNIVKTIDITITEKINTEAIDTEVDELDLELDEDSDSLTKSELDELDRQLELQFEEMDKTVTYKKTTNTTTYKYPKDNLYGVMKHTEEEYGPYSTQNVHDKQHDDVYTSAEKRRQKQFAKLRAVKLPSQRSPEWFTMRAGMLTASDGGAIIGVSKYDAPYTVILKKLRTPPFTSNIHCYHGKKYEEPATMIYSYRMNAQVDEFGLMQHQVHKIVGASPDGICNGLKLDGVSKSNLIGRMLEIKCPSRRKILTEGEIKGEICPIHYWVQVQLQLECCDLDDCDFWQCKITEYKNKKEFVDDTDNKEPFRSATTGFEKGCVIQLMPKSSWEKIDSGEMSYEQSVYEYATFIYQPKVEMTPHECDLWISNEMSSFHQKPEYIELYIDRVFYWRMDMAKNVLIKRDRQWFADVIPLYKKAFKWVLFLRQNKLQQKLLFDYVDTRKMKKNDDIMAVVEKLCAPEIKDYDDYIEDIKSKIFCSPKFKGKKY
jgi:putative phage-type endonuclease